MGKLFLDYVLQSRNVIFALLVWLKAIRFDLSWCPFACDSWCFQLVVLTSIAMTCGISCSEALRAKGGKR